MDRWWRFLEFLIGPWTFSAPDGSVNKSDSAQPGPRETEDVRIYCLGVYDVFWVWTRLTK
jgi:hypothetical protein